MIGIILAMESECNQLLNKENFLNISCHEIQNKKFYLIETKSGSHAIITFSGIGKANAAMTTALLINSFNVDLCINIGSCGIVSGIDIGQVLVVDKVSYCDVDVTGFGYEINQVPRMPVFYETNHILNDEVINMLTIGNFDFKLGNAYTSDSFINKKNLKNFHIKESKVPIVIEMELCAIAQVCSLAQVKLIALKIGIDKLNEPQTNEEQFKDNLNLIASKIDIITLNLIDVITYFLQKKGA